MIVHQPPIEEVLISGEMQSIDVGLSDRPEDQIMIMNILSATLYTDKVAAVLREYSVNAVDANIEAGRGDVPIEVSLPTRLDPSLSIRDFGYGMSEEKMNNTFARMSASTKRTSNLVTGMLGIGSKAGWAYGDSFLVTSYVDGRKTVYNCYRDNGIPRITKMYEEATEAPDGIEVKVPVRQQDILEFERKAAEVFKYFRVTPKIRNANISFARPEAEFSGTGWRYTGSGRSVAIMGNVGYTIDARAMGLTGGKLDTLLSLGVELDFAIGELEIAANREGLQYRDLTKKALTARLAVISQEIGKVLSKKIEGAKTLWEAKCLYGDLFEKTGSYTTRNLRGACSDNVVWQGQQINSARVTLEQTVPADPAVHVSTITKYNWRSRLDRNPNPHSIHARTDEVLLILNDLASGKNSPSREKGIFAKYPSCATAVIMRFDTDAAKTRYLKRCGLEGAPLISLNSIPPVVTASSRGSYGTSAHRSKHRAKAFVWDGKTLGGARSEAWTTESVDRKDGEGVYVRLDSFFVNAGGGLGMTLDPYSFQRLVQELGEAGFKPDKIYGFKQDVIGKLGDGWVDLKTWLQDKIDDLTPAQLQELSDFQATRGYTPLLDVAILPMIPKGGVMHNYLSTYKTAAFPQSIQPEVAEFMSAHAVAFNVPKLPNSKLAFAKMDAVVRTQYPLIGVMAENCIYQLQRASTPKQLKPFADYITLLDASVPQKKAA